MKDYEGDLRIVFKHNPLPFHKSAMPAALAAEAAGKQGKFWEMHDKLFGDPKGLTPENFEKYAKEIGLNVAQFKKDMESDEVKKRIQAQQKEGAKFGARGTPAFFINGRFLSGAQPLANFKKLIDEELKRADEELKKGTPKGKLYEQLIAKGKPGV
jgi:protein-disulfide isomerase